MCTIVHNHRFNIAIDLSALFVNPCLIISDTTTCETIKYEYSTGNDPMGKDHFYFFKEKISGNKPYLDRDPKGSPNNQRMTDGLTAEGMIIFVRKTVEQYQAKYDFENADCVSLAVMSHGGL